MLGKPNEGLHSLRLMNIAIIDVLLTFIVAKINQVIFHKLFPYPYWIWLLITFLFGILVHRVFCVNTTINRFLFGTI